MVEEVMEEAMEEVMEEAREEAMEEAGEETMEEAGEEAMEEAEDETVRYCDKVFDLLDRTDESWARCRWSERLSPGRLTDCEGGLECEGECVPWPHWCPAQPGSSLVWRCGGLLSSPELCSHSAFWSARPCGQLARCTGWWPGQCPMPGNNTQSVSQSENIRKYLELKIF